MKKINLPKLHLITENENKNRPILTYILVTKEHIVASDAMQLVVFPTKSIFNDEFIKKMPKRFLIHNKHWKLLYNSYGISIEKNRITIQFKYHKLDFEVIKETEYLKFPDWENIIPNPENMINEINRIALNPNILKTLSDCMIPNYEYNKGLKLKFNSQDTAILVKPLINHYECKGIIMPMMITD